MPPTHQRAREVENQMTNRRRPPKDSSVTAASMTPSSVLNGHIPPYEIQNSRLADNSADGRVVAPESLTSSHHLQ